jgi:hypothetical protein
MIVFAQYQEMILVRAINLLGEIFKWLLRKKPQREQKKPLLSQNQKRPAVRSRF